MLYAPSVLFDDLDEDLNKEKGRGKRFRFLCFSGSGYLIHCLLLHLLSFCPGIWNRSLTSGRGKKGVSDAGVALVRPVRPFTDAVRYVVYTYTRRVGRRKRENKPPWKASAINTCLHALEDSVL